jgi:hypothetical protein
MSKNWNISGFGVLSSNKTISNTQTKWNIPAQLYCDKKMKTGLI